MNGRKQITGKEGEERACAYLEGLGHTIVARNWRNGHLEIDIISMTPGELHFVEVKSKTAPVIADPLLNIGPAKQKHMVDGAKAFLNSPSRGTLPKELEICFDALTIIFHKNPAEIEIEYYPKAFYPIYV